MTNFILYILLFHERYLTLCRFLPIKRNLYQVKFYFFASIIYFHASLESVGPLCFDIKVMLIQLSSLHYHMCAPLCLILTTFVEHVDCKIRSNNNFAFGKLKLSFNVFCSGRVSRFHIQVLITLKNETNSQGKRKRKRDYHDNEPGHFTCRFCCHQNQKLWDTIPCFHFFLGTVGLLWQFI